jgi:hypothetical protein
MPMLVDLSRKELEVVQFTDRELMKEAFETITAVEDGPQDRLYWLISEMCERWAPAAHEDEEMRHCHESFSDEAEAERELESRYQAIDRRRRARRILAQGSRNG